MSTTKPNNTAPSGQENPSITKESLDAYIGLIQKNITSIQNKYGLMNIYWYRTYDANNQKEIDTQYINVKKVEENLSKLDKSIGELDDAAREDLKLVQMVLKLDEPGFMAKIWNNNDGLTTKYGENSEKLIYPIHIANPPEKIKKRLLAIRKNISVEVYDKLITGVYNPRVREIAVKYRSARSFWEATHRDSIDQDNISRQYRTYKAICDNLDDFDRAYGSLSDEAKEILKNKHIVPYIDNKDGKNKEKKTYSDVNVLDSEEKIAARLYAIAKVKPPAANVVKGNAEPAEPQFTVEQVNALFKKQDTAQASDDASTATPAAPTTPDTTDDDRNSSLSRPLSEIQKICRQNGLPIPQRLSRRVQVSATPAPAASIASSSGNSAPTRTGEGNHDGLPLLSEAQEHDIETQVDTNLDMAYRMIETREDIDELLKHATRASYVIDYVIDPIVGFLPGIGDGISATCGLYIIQKAKKGGVPKSEIRKMYLRLAADFVLGLIPFVGDFADLFYKPSKANAEVFRKYVELEKKNKYIPKF